MGEAEALEKSWLVGRGGGRGEIANSDVVIYGDGDNRKFYSLPPNWNGDDINLD